MNTPRGHVNRPRGRSDRLPSRNLVDSLPGMIWRSTPLGSMVSLNQPWMELTGSPLPDLLGQRWKSHLHPDDHASCDSAFRAAARDRKGFSCEVRMKGRHGDYRWLSVTAYPLLAGARLRGYHGNASDITPHKSAEEHLRQYQERYKAFVEDSGDGVWRFETTTPVPTDIPVAEQVERILHSAYLAECNTALARFFGYPTANDVLGASIRNFVRQDDPQHMNFLSKFVREGYRLSDEQVTYHDRTGRARYFQASFHGIVEGGSLRRAWGSLKDITERTVAERKLHLLAQTVTSARDCISITDMEDRILFVNDAFVRTYGYTEEQLIGSPISMVRPQHSQPGTTQEILPTTLATGGWYGEILNRRADGSEFAVELWTSVVHNDSGEPVALVGVARDVTERKRIEEQIRESLREKEVLLKEIHHRVKNNMQVISSLLSLQSEYLKDETIVRVLRESQNRVKSMALIHEKLYQSKNLAVVDFGDYLRELSTQIFRSYGMSTSKVNLTLDIDNVLLSVDRAIPCGIIVNELVSNALKYAFPNGRGGAVDLSFREIAHSRVELMIQDNGIGMPAGVTVSTAESLGLSLVRMLTEQIQGEVLTGNDAGAAATGSGTRYTLRFPK